MSESHFFSTPLVYSEACLVQVQQRGESDRPQEAAEHHRPLQEQRPSAAGGGNGGRGVGRPGAGPTTTCKKEEGGKGGYRQRVDDAGDEPDGAAAGD